MRKILFLFALLCLGGLQLSAQTNIFTCSTSNWASTSGGGVCAIDLVGYREFSLPFLLVSPVSGAGLSGGNALEMIIAPPGAHSASGLVYQTPVNVQAFTTTWTFIPDGKNISITFNNTNNTPGFQGGSFVAGAGCEAGFFQAFAGPSPNNVFSVELDQGDALTSAGSFTYSSIQAYPSQSDPCQPPYNSDYTTPKYSTSPVPLNSPAGTKLTTTGDVYVAKLVYDGSTLTFTMYDQTLGNTCPGAGCFTYPWTGMNIPAMVAGNTAYVGLMAGDNSDAAANLYINAWSYTVNTAPGTPTLSNWTTTSAAGPPPYAATPTFSPAQGTYTTGQTVTISDSTSGATICYSINPTVYPWADGVGGCGAGTVYTGPISVPSTQTIIANAGTNVSTGAPGAMASATYTISPGSPYGLGAGSKLGAGASIH